MDDAPAAVVPCRAMDLTPSGRRKSGKASDVIAILERRVRGGDYLVAPLPAERELATELGVSYMTARKAVLTLQERGLLERGPTGRLRLATRGGISRVAQVAFLAPAFPSSDVMRWRLAIDRLSTAADCAVKSHFYVHWDDPALLDIIERGDGAFLYPSAEQLSPVLERRIREHAKRVVVIDRDWSPYGLPSMRLTPPRVVQALLDHLASRGHRRIACLNTQPDDEVIVAYMDAYRAWAAGRGMEPEVIDRPVRAGEDPAPQARTVIGELLRGRKPGFTALFCPIAPTAIGAMRGLHAAGLVPGKDVAVCTVNDEGLGDLLIPSLTAQVAVDPTPYLRRGLEWILDPDSAWKGPLLLEPQTVTVAARESTGG